MSDAEDAGGNSSGWDSDDAVHRLDPKYKDMFGEVVWAKQTGFPDWPAMIWDPRYAEKKLIKAAYNSLGKSHVVRFYQEGYMFALIPYQNIKNLIENQDKMLVQKQLKPKQKKTIVSALEEAKLDARKSLAERREFIHSFAPTVVPRKAKAAPAKKKGRSKELDEDAPSDDTPPPSPKAESEASDSEASSQDESDKASDEDSEEETVAAKRSKKKRRGSSEKKKPRPPPPPRKRARVLESDDDDAFEEEETAVVVPVEAPGVKKARMVAHIKELCAKICPLDEYKDAARKIPWTAPSKKRPLSSDDKGEKRSKARKEDGARSKKVRAFEEEAQKRRLEEIKATSNEPVWKLMKNEEEREKEQQEARSKAAPAKAKPAPPPKKETPKERGVRLVATLNKAVKADPVDTTAAMKVLTKMDAFVCKPEEFMELYWETGWIKAANELRSHADSNIATAAKALRKKFKALMSQLQDKQQGAEGGDSKPSVAKEEAGSDRPKPAVDKPVVTKQVADKPPSAKVEKPANTSVKTEKPASVKTEKPKTEKSPAAPVVPAIVAPKPRLPPLMLVTAAMESSHPTPPKQDRKLTPPPPSAAAQPYVSVLDKIQDESRRRTILMLEKMLAPSPKARQIAETIEAELYKAYGMNMNGKQVQESVAAIDGVANSDAAVVKSEKVSSTVGREYRNAARRSVFLMDPESSPNTCKRLKDKLLGGSLSPADLVTKPASFLRKL